MLRSGLLLLMCLFMVLSGCDGTETDREQIPVDLAGTYTFGTFVFDADEPRLNDFDMLDTLDLAVTRLQIFDSGDFVLSYRFKQGTTRPVTGQINYAAQKVAMLPGNMYMDKLTGVLFTSPILMDYTPGASTPLVATVRMNSNIYEGIPQVMGTLRLRLYRLPVAVD